MSNHTSRRRGSPFAYLSAACTAPVLLVLLFDTSTSLKLVGWVATVSGVLGAVFAAVAIRRRRHGQDRQVWLTRVQEFSDPHLRDRLVAVVDAALTAGPADVDTGQFGIHTSASWSWRSADDVAAQRQSRTDGRVDRGAFGGVAGVDDSWMVTGADSWSVRFMPGAGFETPGEFLDWFEQQVAARREGAR
jgi:hypothetical protein